jgi:VWFA-related protein
VSARAAARLMALCVAGAGGCSVVRAQEKPPSFPSNVELVTVDVVVTDKQGNPVVGLDRSDFTLVEEGAAQTIATFEAVTGRDEPPPTAVAPRNPRVSTNSGAPVRPGRALVIVFDQPHLSAEQAERGRRALGRFLRGSVFDGERVRLVAVGGRDMVGNRDDLLAALPELEGGRVPDKGPEAISDHEAMRLLLFDDQPLLMTVLHRFQILTSGQHTVGVEGERIHAVTDEERGGAAKGGTYDEGYVKALARRVYHDATRRNEATLDTLTALLDSLRSVRGRKSVVLVSEGFIKDPELPGYEQVLDASRRANAALYFLDTRGLEPLLGTAERQIYLPNATLGASLADQASSAAGSETLAADSGGFTVKNRNDLATGLMRITSDTRNYYLLGYSPSSSGAYGAFRKIQVKVRRKDAVVRARKGYYSGALTPAAGASDLEDALREPQDRAGVPLRLSAYVFGESRPGRMHTLVATDVDLRGLSLQEQDGRFVGAVDVLLTVTPAAGGAAERYAQQVELKLVPERRQVLAKTGLPIVRGFELGPGAWRARVVVRDRQSGRVGSVAHSFEVPGAAWRTSTPVLSDTLDELSDASRPVPAVAARRVFAPRGRLYFQFDVYGAERDAASGQPQVLAGWSVRGYDGTTHALEEPARLVPSPRGALTRTGQLPLSLPPGDYELVLDLRDAVSGRTLVLREPFAVEEASGS